MRLGVDRTPESNLGYGTEIVNIPGTAPPAVLSARTLHREYQED
jgi:hypothetical protein